MTKRHTGHRKRIATPKSYHIPRKSAKYLARTFPGSHNKEYSLPLVVLLRDTLKIIQTSKEAKVILNDNKIFVDQTIKKNHRFPVGPMDVISIPDMKQNFRLLFGTDGRLKLMQVTDENAKFKLCKILNKRKIAKGKTQLNLHDGRNILIDEDNVKTGDTLKIALPNQKILESYPLAKGVKVIITHGKHIGEIAVVEDFLPQPGSQRDRIVLTSENGEKFETLKSYAFVIGKEKSEIKLTED